jgi:hypothetical protein
VTARLRGALDVARAALWAARALSSTRRQLRRGDLAELVVAPPPPLPAKAGRGVELVLRAVTPRCLERALVLQRWLAAHGRRHDVVVGVSKTGAEFAAHAWVDVEEPWAERNFAEIARLAP